MPSENGAGCIERRSTVLLEEAYLCYLWKDCQRSNSGLPSKPFLLSRSSGDFIKKREKKLLRRDWFAVVVVHSHCALTVWPKPRVICFGWVLTPHRVLRYEYSPLDFNINAERGWFQRREIRKWGRVGELEGGRLFHLVTAMQQPAVWELNCDNQCNCEVGNLNTANRLLVESRQN